MSFFSRLFSHKTAPALKHQYGLAVSYEQERAANAVDDWRVACAMLEARSAAIPEAEYEAFLLKVESNLRVILVFGNDFPETFQDKFYEHNNPAMHGHVERCTADSCEHLFRNGKVEEFRNFPASMRT
ncbi:MAG: hypothetical protein ACKV22_16895 [Bryobacteraceae bacterium]